jgi:hypothetical protein
MRIALTACFFEAGLIVIRRFQRGRLSWRVSASVYNHQPENQSGHNICRKENDG